MMPLAPRVTHARRARAHLRANADCTHAQSLRRIPCAMGACGEAQGLLGRPTGSGEGSPHAALPMRTSGCSGRAPHDQAMAAFPHHHACMRSGASRLQTGHESKSIKVPMSTAPGADPWPTAYGCKRGSRLPGIGATDAWRKALHQRSTAADPLRLGRTTTSVGPPCTMLLCA